MNLWRVTYWNPLSPAESERRGIGVGHEYGESEPMTWDEAVAFVDDTLFGEFKLEPDEIDYEITQVE